ncbi:MAG: PEP-utilizing enzyme [Promethearchaeati archaeon]
MTETGGVLSHGAVVSREFGIPAVTNVSRACKLVTTGQTVTIDGYKGKVIIHEENE